MQPDFENIYDTYCPLLYSITLQLCPTEIIAEEILLETFRKIHRRNSACQPDQPFCLPLIKLMIETAKEHLHPAESAIDVKIKEFENTPLLHQLLIQQQSIENYCSKNDVTRQLVLLKIRKEFKHLLRLSKKSNNKRHKSNLAVPQLHM